MRAGFCASTGPGPSGRRVIWEEHESGRVSACSFYYWDERGGVDVDSLGVIEMALRKGYKLPVPDLLLGHMAEAVKIGGPAFENASALLSLCEIPQDAERVPMHPGAVSLGP